MPEVRDGEGKEMGVSINEYHWKDHCGDGTVLCLDCGGGYTYIHI